MAKDQGLANGCDIGGLAHQVEVPIAVFSVAEQYRTGNLAVLQHDALVDPAPGIAKHDVLTALATGEVASREHINA